MKRRRAHRIQRHLRDVYICLVQEGWCEVVLEQSSGCRSLSHYGVFGNLNRRSMALIYRDASGDFAFKG